jgi:hypothetical protein
MNFLLYATLSKEISQSVREMLSPMLPGATVELYQTLSELWLRLQNRKDGALTLLFLPGSREDITDLIAIRHLLRDIPVLLVLPDLEDETVALAHRLGPRHLTYVNNNFSGLVTVLEEMVARPV